MAEKGCNGICLTAADIGVPEYGWNVIAYAHPDCPEHGYDYGDAPDVCSPGEDETARYVREEDVSHAEDRGAEGRR